MEIKKIYIYTILVTWLLRVQIGANDKEAASLKQSSSIIALAKFEPRVAGSLVKRLAPKGWPNASVGFEVRTFD